MRGWRRPVDVFKFVLQALKDQVRVDLHQEKLYDKVSTFLLEIKYGPISLQ